MYYVLIDYTTVAVESTLPVILSEFTFMHFDMCLQVTEKSELFATQMTMMRFVTYNNISSNVNGSTQNSRPSILHNLVSSQHRQC